MLHNIMLKMCMFQTYTYLFLTFVQLFSTALRQCIILNQVYAHLMFRSTCEPAVIFVAIKSINKKRYVLVQYPDCGSQLF